VKTNARRARALTIVGFLLGLGALVAPFQAAAGLLSGVTVPPLPPPPTVSTVTVPPLPPPPTVPTVTVPPPPPPPTVPTVKLPPPPKVPSVTVSAPAPLPKAPAVKLPALQVSSGPSGQVRTPTVPNVPSVTVPSPTLGGSSRAPEGFSSTATASRAGGQGAGPSPFLGGGFSGPLAAAEAATARALGGLTQHDRARIADLLLLTTVLRLEGCLRYLPPNLRRVLELITGVDVPIALSAKAVAEQLNVSLAKVSRLERLALRRLRMTARTYACGAATQASTDPFVFGGLAALVGEEGGPAGGVEAARNATSPYSQAADAQGSSPGGHTLLGINNPALEGGAMLLIVGILAGLLLTGLALTDERLPWPIYREWRSRWIHSHPGRWIHRHPWRWHG
jgi:Sigma-70, region 4